MPLSSEIDGIRFSDHATTPKHSSNLKRTWIQRIRHQFALPVSLDWQLDNLGPIFPGSTICGRLVLNVTEDQVKLFDLTAAIDLKKTHRKAFNKRCMECMEQITPLGVQAILAEPTILCRGRHEFRFSVSLPDGLPPSLNTSILATTYEVKAQVCICKVNSASIAQDVPIEINLNRVLCVQQPPLKPILPRYLSHNVSRTGIRVSTYYDPLVNLHRPNRVSMNIDGLLSPGKNGEDSEMWRLMKGAWSIEETIKTVSQACERHSSQTTRAEERKAIHTKTSRLGGKELYDGWKACEKDGSLDFTFDFAFKGDHKIHSHVGYLGSLELPLGFEVVHSLVMELVFVLEHLPEGHAGQAIRTGQARISRLPFRIFLASNHEMDMDVNRVNLPSYNDEWLLPPGYDEEEFNRE